MLKKEYYLTSGEKTQQGTNVKKAADSIEGKNSIEIVMNILRFMGKEVKLDQDSKSSKKFKRSAEEILIDGDRNGCCDSSTLFVALCRAKGIPAVQIITADMNALKNGDFNTGHFFSGCYLEEEKKWIIIDSNVKEDDLENKEGKKRKKLFYKFNANSKFIDDDFYIFAYLRDYSEFEKNGVKIDSAKSTRKIHEMIYNDYLSNDIDLD